jgi:hypothetical protein
VSDVEPPTETRAQTDGETRAQPDGETRAHTDGETPEGEIPAQFAPGLYQPGLWTALRELLRSVLGAISVAVGALSTGWPENVFQWLLLVLAVLLGAAAPHTQVSDAIGIETRRVLHAWRPSRPLRLRRLLMIGLAMLLAAGFGRSLVTGGGRLADWGTVRLFGCGAPTELRVLTTTEGLDTARRLADVYTASTTRGHQGCPTVTMYVYAQPDGEARAALQSGWQANALGTLGPRPDIWLPGSTRYPLTDPAQTSNGQLRAVWSTSVANTPLVVAVPSGVVPADLRARRAELTWSETLAAVGGLGWGVARPEPARSVTGELATVAMYASGGGAPERLAEPAVRPNLVDLPRAREIEGQVARGLDQGGYPLGDAAELLCQQRQHPPEGGGALVVTEQQMIQFNAGAALGGACPATGPATPERALYALYPVDTLSLDNPLVELEWADRSPDQGDGVAAFHRWLVTEPGKRVLNEAGLRPPNWPASDPLSDRFGAQQGVSYLRVQPSDRVLAEARSTRQAAQRPGRVLLLLDASGSMAESADPAGRSRFELAVRAVDNIAGRMSGRDEFGLWSFQGPVAAPRSLVPIGREGSAPGGMPHGAAVTAALARVHPGGNTPLYRAILDGVRAVGPADASRVSALVVLTDGADEGSGVSPAQVLAAARAGGVRIFVVAVGEARCAAQVIRQVTGATAGACYDTDFTSLDTRLTELFDTLWGGTGR